MYMNSLPN